MVVEEQYGREKAFKCEECGFHYEKGKRRLKNVKNTAETTIPVTQK